MNSILSRLCLLFVCCLSAPLYAVTASDAEEVMKQTEEAAQRAELALRKKNAIPVVQVIPEYQFVLREKGSLLEHQYASLNKKLGMQNEEFAAVKKLIERVDYLLIYYDVLINGDNERCSLMDRGVWRVSEHGRGDIMVSGMTAKGEMTGWVWNLVISEAMTQSLYAMSTSEPVIVDLEKSLKILRNYTKDEQANKTELQSALQRVNKACESYNVALQIARDELRSILTTRQEAVLFQRGTLN